MIAQHDLRGQAMAAQSAFRAIMDATARPGSPQPITAAPDAPAPLSGEAAAIVLTLFDQDTPVWLDEPLADAPDLADWVRFHTGAPMVRDPDLSAFALIGDPARLPALDRFNQGAAEYPDRSTTLILQVASFEEGETMILTGPGIRGAQPFRAAPLPSDMSERIAANRSLFPRGVDLLLAAPQRIAALPRSVRLKRE
jgi:alpha-D-ribose 1-methylphosphonate 5-triphosphate synthase subunit PhnH